MRSAGTSSSFLKSTPLETLMASTLPCWFISTSVTFAGLTSCSPRSPSVASTFIPGTIAWSSLLRFSLAISPQSLALPSLLSDMLCYLFTIWKAPILSHPRDKLAHLKRHRYTADITDLHGRFFYYTFHQPLKSQHYCSTSRSQPLPECSGESIS